MWILRRVVGNSMLPALRPGDVVIGQRGKQPQIDDIVIAKVFDKEVIKRIVKIDATGYELRGDNSKASTDSRNFGKLERNHIKGVVVKIIKSRRDEI